MEKDIADHRHVIAALDDDIREFTEEPLISTEDALELLEIQQRRDRAM